MRKLPLIEEYQKTLDILTPIIKTMVGNQILEEQKEIKHYLVLAKNVSRLYKIGNIRVYQWIKKGVLVKYIMDTGEVAVSKEDLEKVIREYYNPKMKR